MLALAPIGLSRSQAAEYIGVGATLFDKMVSDGRMPDPIAINSRRVWNRLEVEKSFEALKYADAPPASGSDILDDNPEDDWEDAEA